MDEGTLSSGQSLGEGERTQTHGSNRVNGSCLSSVKKTQKVRKWLGEPEPSSWTSRGLRRDSQSSYGCRKGAKAAGKQADVCESL